MQARQFPIQRGWQWLFEGVALWKRNPAFLTFASFGYLLILLILSAIPLLGQAVASLLMPVLSLGVLNVCRAIDEGQKGAPNLLFSGFKSNVAGLIGVGGIYLVASLLVVLITSLLDGGTLMSILRSAATGDELAQPTNLGFSLISVLLLSTPVIMAYWFAPVLAGWWQQPAIKAMFFSFYAFLRNWRPFLVYALSLLILVGVLPSVLIGLVGAVMPPLATLLVLVLPLFIVPVVFASFYINARDVFGAHVVDEHLVD